MSYNNTENLHLEFSTETHFINGQFSSTGTVNGVSYRETLTFQIGVKFTKILLNYTGSGVYIEIGIASTRVWLKLECRIWLTQAVTTTTVTQFSSRENKKGNKKPLIPQNFIDQLVLTLHNKDPPYFYKTL